MSEREAIEQMIREGRLGADEGLKLLEAFEVAQARDSALREELRHRRRKQATGWMGWMMSLLLVGIVCGWIGAKTTPTDSHTAATSGSLAQQMQDLLGEDINQAIARMEHVLRSPSGIAADYYSLGLAYQLRYQVSKDEADQKRSAQVWARAQQLERRTAMKGNPALFGLLFVIVIGTAVILWIMALYNGLAKADERINERWAQVEAVLQRRLDLIPQLVETVKGYAVHERETLTAITQARAKTLGILQATGGQAPESAKTMIQVNEAQQEMSHAIGKLLALVEQYPDLKAGTNFLTLQDQLEGTENRISVERQRYNEVVRAYNAKLRVFPSNAVAGWFGYEPRGYFESKAGAEEPVPVKF